MWDLGEAVGVWEKLLGCRRSTAEKGGGDWEAAILFSPKSSQHKFHAIHPILISIKLFCFRRNKGKMMRLTNKKLFASVQSHSCGAGTREIRIFYLHFVEVGCTSCTRCCCRAWRGGGSAELGMGRRLRQASPPVQRVQFSKTFELKNTFSHQNCVKKRNTENVFPLRSSCKLVPLLPSAVR
jgi:hypothetical protein